MAIGTRSSIVWPLPFWSMENQEPVLTVDLPDQQIITPHQGAIDFEVDAFRKDCLLRGLDDIGLTLQHEEAIREFEGRHREAAPWLFNNQP